MKWLFFYLIILVPSKILGQCYEEISSSTLYIAEEKLFNKTKEVIAQEISDLLKKTKLGNRDTEYKIYHYRVKIDSKGNIKDIFFIKIKNINKKIDMLLKNYIQTLAPLRQSAYINEKGENISFIESFSIYIQIEENGIMLKLPSQEIVKVN